MTTLMTNDIAQAIEYRRVMATLTPVQLAAVGMAIGAALAAARHQVFDQGAGRFDRDMPDYWTFAVWQIFGAQSAGWAVDGRSALFATNPFQGVFACYDPEAA